MFLEDGKETKKEFNNLALNKKSVYNINYSYSNKKCFNFNKNC